MNSTRLLTGLLLAALWSLGACAYAEDVPKTFTLKEIFESAETNGVHLRPLLTAEKVAEKQVSVAKSGRLPEINAALSLSYIGDGFITDRDFSNYTKAPIPHLGNGLSVKVEQAVYTGGAIKNAIDMAKMQSTAARYATDFQRDNIRFRLAGFYLDLYKYSNLKEVMQKNIEQAQQVLDDMKARYSQGTALQNDITRYELLVSTLELQLVKIDNTLQILNDNLVVTAGLPEGTVVLPDSSIFAESLPGNEPAWWQQEAEGNAPSLQLAESGVNISRKAESLIKSERLPQIGVQAFWTLDGPILVEIPPLDKNLSYWYVGLGVSYNFSSLYKSSRKLAATRLSTQQAQEELDVARENIALAVRANYIRYMEAYQELLTQQKSVELASRNYRTTSTRYAADMALITDMLDAANAQLDAEQQLVNARINIIYYYYKLLFTTGKI
ncbi:MAG: TolC family protein [Bacteroides sp.]|nr:TolC family protein [Ruminococcus flavefaciens]MCM1554341.1 TolC family protein [Bacteroides sp.]